MRVEAQVTTGKGHGVPFDVLIHGAPAGLDRTAARTIDEARRLVAQMTELSAQAPPGSVMVDLVAGDSAAARAIQEDRLGAGRSFDPEEARGRHRRGEYRAAS
ncbi:hypothetical protein ABII15_30610 [Streptomyces sp. HUAS MG91]|uniref:Uncharacterized protein n=1 Tax=Streptomyces tabacisoli TaxID=3156398 RepID=A0AAU8J1C4_9ACTN